MSSISNNWSLCSNALSINVGISHLGACTDHMGRHSVTSASATFEQTVNVGERIPTDIDTCPPELIDLTVQQLWGFPWKTCAELWNMEGSMWPDDALCWTSVGLSLFLLPPKCCFIQTNQAKLDLVALETMNVGVRIASDSCHLT